MSGVGAFQCRKCQQYVFFVEQGCNPFIEKAQREQLCGKCAPRSSYNDVLWSVAEMLKLDTVCACENGHCMGLPSCVCRMEIARRIASVVSAGVSNHDEQSNN